MLRFFRKKDLSTKENLFCIEETIQGFDRIGKKFVSYTEDIRWKKVNNDPWLKTTMADRQWFNKHYRHNFEED